MRPFTFNLNINVGCMPVYVLYVFEWREGVIVIALQMIKGMKSTVFVRASVHHFDVCWICGGFLLDLWIWFQLFVLVLWTHFYLIFWKEMFGSVLDFLPQQPSREVLFRLRGTIEEFFERKIYWSIAYLELNARNESQ